jgi:hypothetical protein
MGEIIHSFPWDTIQAHDLNQQVIILFLGKPRGEWTTLRGLPIPVILYYAIPYFNILLSALWDLDLKFHSAAAKQNILTAQLPSNMEWQVLPLFSCPWTVWIYMIVPLLDQHLWKRNSLLISPAKLSSLSGRSQLANNFYHTGSDLMLCTHFVLALNLMVAIWLA